MMIQSPSPAAAAPDIELAPLPVVLEAIREGRPVLVLDDAGRENEADLICAAERVTPR